MSASERPVAAVATLGLPFAAALLVASRAAGGVALPCPMREVTGVPCPLCGATRSFELVVSGDPAWLLYNPYWVVVAAFGMLVGLAWLVLGRTHRPRAPAVLGRWRVVALLVVVALPGWILAIAHRGAITG